MLELLYSRNSKNSTEKRYSVGQNKWRNLVALSLSNLTSFRGEVKENRVGGKFRTVAVWDVPPADVNLWTREQAKPRKTFALGGR